MAKKKANNNHNNQQKNTQEQTRHLKERSDTELVPSDSERFQSLKSLNSLLLKETHDRRAQVEELKQINASLETKLALSGSKRDLLTANLARSGDELEMLEMEKGFLEAYMRAEMGGRIRVLEGRVEELSRDVANEKVFSSRLIAENDGLKREMGGKGEAVDVLRAKVLELEKSESKNVSEIRKLETAIAEKGSVIESLMNEKALLDGKLDCLLNEIKEEREVSNRIKSENNILKRDISVMNEEASMLKKKVSEFENWEKNTLSKLQKLENDIAELSVTKRDGERVVESLVNEKILLERRVDDLLNDIEKAREQSSHAMLEIDRLNCEIGTMTEEANVLRVEAVEFRERESKIVDELRKVGNEYAELVVEEKEREGVIDSLVNEKKLLKEYFDESVKFREVLEKGIREMTQKMEEIEAEKNGQTLMIQGLDREVSKLNENLLTLQTEGEMLHVKVSDLENANEKLVQQKDQILLEYTELEVQNKENGIKTEMLLEEKSQLEKSLQESLDASEVMMQKLQKLLKEKDELDEEKALLDHMVDKWQQELHEIRVGQLVEMKEKLGKLENFLKLTEKDFSILPENQKRMASKLKNLKDTVARVIVDTQKQLDENKIQLNSRVFELAKEIKTSLKEILQLRGENENLLKEKKAIETQFGSLMNEKETAQNNLIAAQQTIDNLKAEGVSVCAKSKLAFELLEKTATALAANNAKDTRDREEDNLANDKAIPEEVQPYVAKLESIKDAFSSREAKIDEMTRQLELHQKVATMEHKKKSFWAMLSSASALVAAASVAYAAHGR